MNKSTAVDFYPEPNAPAFRSYPLAQMPDHDGGGFFNFDLRSLWSLVYRNRFLMLSIMVLVVAAGIALTMLTSPIYRAAARVQIDQQTAKIVTDGDVEPSVGAQDADRFLQTQVDIIKSRSLAQRVAAKLNLLGDEKFLIAMQVAPATKAKGAFDLRTTRREQVLDVLQKGLSVDLPFNSRIAAIQFSSPDRMLAAKVANSFADNLITSNLDRKFDASSYARQFLERELAKTRGRLEQSERSAIAYARNARLIDASSGSDGSDKTGPKSLTTSSLVQLNTSLSALTAARVASEQRWRQAQTGDLMSMPEVLANQTIQQLQQQRAKARSEYEQELQRRKANFPDMIQAAALIKEFDRQIMQVAESIRASIRDQYEVARRQEAALASNVAGLKFSSLAEQDRSVQLNILRREVDTNRALYDGLLQRYKEISAAAGVATNNISILDVATPPILPISPRPLLNLGLSIVLGALFAIAVLVAKEQLDDRILSSDDVTRKLNLTFLGSVPLIADHQRPEEELRDPRSALSEAYLALRTSIELSSAGGVPSTLMFTSTRPAEGKSTSTYALARDFARSGAKVLLIDCDLRKPSLHEVLKVPNTVGITNFLTTQRQIGDAVHRDIEPNLDFIPSGPRPPNPAELLSGPAFRELLAKFATTYNMIVIDAPPVLGLADAPAIAGLVDGVVFVVQANSGHIRQSRLALQRLRGARTSLIGAVLTKYDARKIGYGENYGYYAYSYGAEEV